MPPPAKKTTTSRPKPNLDYGAMLNTVEDAPAGVSRSRGRTSTNPFVDIVKATYGEDNQAKRVKVQDNKDVIQATRTKVNQAAAANDLGVDTSVESAGQGLVWVVFKARDRRTYTQE